MPLVFHFLPRHAERDAQANPELDPPVPASVPS
jgi:hypothetical protein